MAGSLQPPIDYRTVELEGIEYVILRRAVFDLLCQKARLKHQSVSSEAESGIDLDQASMAQKLVRRRRAAGLSQAELARSAGIRPETLNRIERGRTTPDFATIRKLVIAINATEQERAASSIANHSNRETHNAD
jgi:DNA-binding XRE family transcriptional regulator